jgi:hypothetical protein
VRPRFTIATLGFVVVLLALDFAWMRLLHPARGRSIFAFAAQGFDLGILPMANVLAVVAYSMLSRRDRPHPFLLGFLAGGLVAIVGFMAWCWVSPKTVVLLIFPLYRAWSLVQPVSNAGTSILVVGGLSFVLPQLLIAALGGLIARRFAGRRDVDRSAHSGPEVDTGRDEGHDS